jgi:hypothetical protein
MSDRAAETIQNRLGLGVAVRVRVRFAAAVAVRVNVALGIGVRVLVRVSVQMIMVVFVVGQGTFLPMHIFIQYFNRFSKACQSWGVSVTI